MIFTTKAGYGLRAMVQLAKNYSKEPYSLSKISKLEGISLAYLERLMAALKKKGLVRSIKGAKGGYILAKSPSKITVLEVVEALEGSTASFYCVGKKNRKACCPSKCATKDVWFRLQGAIDKTLKEVSLRDLIK